MVLLQTETEPPTANAQANPSDYNRCANGRPPAFGHLLRESGAAAAEWMAVSAGFPRRAESPRIHAKVFWFG